MGVQLYWDLFFVMVFIRTTKNSNHGSPGVLGFIFHYGQPRTHTWESGVLGFILYNGQPRTTYMWVQVYWVLFSYNGQPRTPYMGVQVYWVLFFITDNLELHTWESRCTGFYFSYRTTWNSINGSPGVLGFIFHSEQPRIPMSVQLYWNLFSARHTRACIRVELQYSPFEERHWGPPHILCC